MQPRSFPAKLLLSQLVPHLHWWKRFFSPRCRSLLFLWWKQSLVGLIFKILRSLWNVTPLFGVPATLDLALSTNLLQMSSVPLPRSLMELLNNTHLSNPGWVGILARHQTIDYFLEILAVQTIFSPSDNCLSCLFQLSFQMRMLWNAVSKALPNWIHVTSTTLPSSTWPVVVESSQADQAQFSFGKSILTFSDCLLVLVKVNL